LEDLGPEPYVPLDSEVLPKVTENGHQLPVDNSSVQTYQPQGNVHGYGTSDLHWHYHYHLHTNSNSSGSAQVISLPNQNLLEKENDYSIGNVEETFDNMNISSEEQGLALTDGGELQKIGRVQDNHL
jgi:hypothetical protein